MQTTSLATDGLAAKLIQIARRNKSLRKPANVRQSLKKGLPATSTVPGARGPAVAVLRPSALGMGASLRIPLDVKRTCFLCLMGHDYTNSAALEPVACLAIGDGGG